MPRIEKQRDFVMPFICGFVAGVLIMSAVAFANPVPWKLVEETHVVEAGETLEDITFEYMQKNTYGKREFYEFRSGIIELNPWLMERSIEEGDALKINYWVNNNDDE